MPWGRHWGVPISHNALQHYPECHEADTGGVPSQVQLGGYPARSGRGYPGRVPPAGYPPQGTPSRVPAGQHGGYPGRVSPQQGTSPGRVPTRPGQDGGSTQLGQQKEYSLHGGWYASCVHAGGLSCCIIFLPIVGH